MSILYYEPFYDFERFLDDTLTTRSKPDGTVQRRTRDADSAIPTLRPRMDLHEDSKENIVTATFELPGLKKDDVDIQVTNNRLMISGESKISSEKEENGYGVEEKHIKAGLDNGVLTVTFPKSAAPKEQAPKRIKIN
ncbi:hypothetical protein CVT25_011692 [Psilocybe cyanescens]|uniref:SHSP domain-containing protein n=1 Tax=Psilocybe cyanescens TaxID=93625 RepID=A0A409WIM1_PSICY|nr:hypothetical protein CVT25_011692 [Psilocybe cyanescens]